MTYTILAADRDRGEVGIGITTGSINVGGLAPFFSVHGDVVTSQAYALRQVGIELTRALNDGENLADAFARTQEQDGANFAYRQVAAIRRDGTLKCHTGDKCRPWAGHLAGDGWVVMGNVLKGPGVLDGMAAGFEGSAGAPLWDRLLRGLEGGRDAGGQATPDGQHMRERSAAVRVLAGDLMTSFDLRVDLHKAAVDEARRLSKIIAAIEEYNQLRGKHPPDTPMIFDWEAEHLKGMSVPSARHDPGC